MHFPVYLWLGPLPLHPHWVFEILAYLVASRLYLALRGRGDLLPEADRWTVVTAAMVGAAVGSKLLYWASDPAFMVAHWRDPFVLIGGKSIVGGLVGALCAVEWVKRQVGITRATGDLFVLPLVVGIAIGRIGCFLTGLDDHTYGLPTTLPWGVDFGDGLPRHPAQLYEIGFLVVLWPVLSALNRRPDQPDGAIFKIFLVAYLGFRFLLEFLKPGVAVAGLNAIQWVTLAGLAYYAQLGVRAWWPREAVHG
jgi:phosphatidylglycerol:prolipoprotein diacylglycerol transferase